MEFVEEAYPQSGYPTLPQDAKERAQLRLAFGLIEQYQGAYYSSYMKRLTISDEEIKNIKDKLQKVEDFLDIHQKESGFAWGTEHPTQLDIHFYPFLSRT